MIVLLEVKQWLDNSTWQVYEVYEKQCETKDRNFAGNSCFFQDDFDRVHTMPSV
jgi:hypothetical protein